MYNVNNYRKLQDNNYIPPLVPTLCVGMQAGRSASFCIARNDGRLCYPGTGRRASEMGSHAEHGNQVLAFPPRSHALRGNAGGTLRVLLYCKKRRAALLSRHRTQSVRDEFPRRAWEPGLSLPPSFPRSAWECRRDAPRPSVLQETTGGFVIPAQDAERPRWVPTHSMGTRS